MLMTRCAQHVMFFPPPFTCAGIVDRWTWVVLCRSSAEVHASVNGALSTPLSLDGPLPTKSSAAPASATAAADSSAAPPAAATGAGSSGGDASSSTTSTSTSATSESAASAASLEFTEWPVLMEGDGGKEVQLLQVSRVGQQRVHEKKHAWE